MTSYETGALSALFSGSENPVDDLFKGSEPVPVPEPEPQPELQTEPQPSKKVKKVKKSKKSKKSENNDETEETFQKPSIFSLLGLEEKNRKKPRNEEQEKRTIFVGNLPQDIAKNKLKQTFKEFGEIEAIRLRGAARPDMITTKKVAMITRNFHENRETIIAYIRFKDIESAEKSLQMNGKKVADNTIRVDLSLKDTDNKHDQSKAVFVGNLSFAIKEDDVRDHFKRCGNITDIRIVRDSKTGIGKGFCYVNFATGSEAQTALDLMNGTELMNRKLRVLKSVERPKKTLSLVPKMRKGAFPVKPEAWKNKAKSQTKVVKIKKKRLNMNFKGQFKDDKVKKNDKKVKNKPPSQGERKRKQIAKQLLGK